MKLGLNNDGMQKNNRNLVLRILLEEGETSRSEIAKKTKLQRATITNIVNEFLDMGILTETGSRRENGNRKAEMLGLATKSAIVLCGRITREFFSIYVCSICGEWGKHIKIAIDKKNPIDKTMQIIYHQIDMLVNAYGEQNIIGCCIGLPGPYIRNGKNMAIVTGFEELRNIDFQQAIENRYKFPCLTEHDAKLSAFAEWKSLDMQTQQSEASLIAIQSIGTGIGSGMVINGKICHGSQGVAGEIGHMGVNFYKVNNPQECEGIFENYASTGCITKYVQERMYEFPNSVLNEKSTYDQILYAYQNGDLLAKTAIEKMAWMLAYGLSNLIFIINPNRIILSDDYPKDVYFMEQVKRNMERIVYPELMNSVKILPSSLTMDSTIVGCYYLVIEELLKQNKLLDMIKMVDKI